MTDVNKIDPTLKYKSPQSVFNSSELTVEKKIEILNQWEYMIRNKQSKSADSISADSNTELSQIVSLINQLGATPKNERPDQLK